MRFLVDQDVYALTISLLRKLGHDVVTAKEIGMQRSDDEDLLAKAKESSRIFCARDKDFGSLVYLKKSASAGVILLRVNPNTVDAVHRQIERLLTSRDEKELRGLFCVVESDRYRTRRIVFEQGSKV